MGKLIGYARVSSTDQNLEVQEQQLRDAGCKKVFSEKKTGTTTNGRTALQAALDKLDEDEGDVLIVTRLDRLARSAKDLLAIIETLDAKGATLRCTEQQEINTSGTMGKLMLTILAGFAEFETNIRKERQRDGIAAKKAEDTSRKAKGLAAATYKGRPAKIKADAIRALQAEGFGATEIAKRLQIGRASVYRVLETAAA
jgi:DNA invertase Pin-like site-specific DNA recombinase